MLLISDWLAGPRVRARAVVSGNYRPKPADRGVYKIFCDSGCACRCLEKLNIYVYTFTEFRHSFGSIHAQQVSA
jgi:hypothetical protein